MSCIQLLKNVVLNNTRRSTSTTAAEAIVTSIQYYPTRQPKGPEPGKGFTSRSMNEIDQLTAMLTRQQLGII